MLSLPRCCVCDKEASIRARGMWWCEQHSKYVEEEPKSETDGREKLRTKFSEQRGVSVELGLDWV